jgi:hypothetical protein
MTPLPRLKLRGTNSVCEHDLIYLYMFHNIICFSYYKKAKEMVEECHISQIQ